MAEKGIDFVLSKGVTPVQIAGLRSNGFTINGEAVDVTSKDSAGLRTLLDGAGTTSMTISAAGIYENDAAIIALETDTIAKLQDDYTIDFGNGKSITGKFQPTSYENAGEHNGEVTFTITLESSGVFTITP